MVASLHASGASTDTDTFPEKVSFFASAFAQTPEETLSIGALMQRIQSDEWEALIERLRLMVAKGDKEGYTAAKRRLPAVSLSGTVFTRDASVPIEQRLEAHSGLLQADLDRKDNKQLQDMETVKEQLRADPYVAAFFVSPSGEGLKCLIRIEADVTKHAASFAAVEKHFLDRYGLQIDRSTKDPLRLCFVSHDPMPWLNPDARILPPLAATTPSKPSGRMPDCWRPPVDTSAGELLEMLCYIPPKPDYDDWLRISSAVWTVLPMEEGTRLLMQWSPEEKPGEYAEKWKARLKQIGVGTLVHYAQQYGFDPAAAGRRRIQRNGGKLRLIFPRPVLPAQSTAASLPASAKTTTAAPQTAINGTELPPALHTGSLSALATLQQQRHLPCFAGLQIASDRGLLRFGNVWDADEEHPAWILTDDCRRVAQARRMDGQHWQDIGGKKAKTLPGSASGWPVGTATIWEHDAVLFAAGGPDLLATFTLLCLMEAPLSRIGVVALMGENIGISPEALPLFKGKHVRLIYRQDAAGKAACVNRARELRAAGATVDAFNLSQFLPASGGKDLNDCITPDASNPFHPELPAHFLKRLPL